MNVDQVENKPLIVNVIYRLDVGGMENGLINLINRMQGGRYRHAIICLTESSEFANRINSKDVAVYELHKREGKDLSFYCRFWRLLRSLKPAILHTRNLGALDLVILGRLVGVPIRVHGEHGWDAGDLDGTSAKYRVLRKVCDSAVHKYVAVSNDIAAWLREGIGIRQEHIVQIYNGVDVDVFSPDGEVAALPFDRHEANMITIGAIGRMDPIKSFDCLLKAVKVIITRYPDLESKLRVVLIGDGMMLEEYRQQVVELGLEKKVWMPGTRRDIPQLLRAMDLFVLPSRNEGISNTVLESMAAGLPVIALNVGGNPEIIRDGVTGRLIVGNDIEALTAAILSYVESADMRRLHGEAARKLAKDRFSLESMVDGYLQMYDRLLGASQFAKVH